ncbi:unnamed protein product [Clonostachys rosea]|uniref:Alcohol dehydrogenase-like C-terminal domain-containing protein n=1 Tax=Bionectria ochroleuca TaxID=29856 RepID=A0ABY6U0R1_BIOOC|nr:unnamed protein product [Clonostachys rosea]
MEPATTYKNKALWLTSFSKAPSIVDRPVPEASTGSIVIRVLAAGVLPYTHLVHTGQIPQLNLRLPLVPNPCAVGLICATGPDAVRVQNGDLVYFDGTARGRDDPEVVVMPGHHGGEGSRGLMLSEGEWRDGSLQQYQKVPLESVHVLDKARLLGELGYSPVDLQTVSFFCVVGGAIMQGADLRPAETIIIGPSGGTFSGIAVEMSLALGANVVALGRNEAKLADMKKRLQCPGRFSYVVMTGDRDADQAAILKQTPNGAGADVYNDWTPSWVNQSPYLLAGAQSLKKRGRVILSGGTMSEVIGVPYQLVVGRELRILGSFMSSRDTVRKVIRMVEQGMLNVGARSGSEVSVFSLDQHEEAIAHSSEQSGWRKYTVITPNPY